MASDEFYQTRYIQVLVYCYCRYILIPNLHRNKIPKDMPPENNSKRNMWSKYMTLTRFEPLLII